MKLDLNFNLLDIEGKEIEGLNAGKTVAKVLAQDTSGDALKMWDWAKKLHAGEELELDLSDFTKFRDYIKNSPSFTVLLKGQVLPLLIV